MWWENITSCWSNFHAAFLIGNLVIVPSTSRAHVPCVELVEHPSPKTAEVDGAQKSDRQRVVVPAQVGVREGDDRGAYFRIGKRVEARVRSLSHAGDIGAASAPERLRNLGRSGSETGASAQERGGKAREATAWE